MVLVVVVVVAVVAMLGKVCVCEGCTVLVDTLRGAFLALGVLIGTTLFLDLKTSSIYFDCTWSNNCTIGVVVVYYKVATISFHLTICTMS